MTSSRWRVRIRRLVLSGLDVTTERAERIRERVALETERLLAGAEPSTAEGGAGAERIRAGTALRGTPGDGALANGIAARLAGAIAPRGRPARTG